MHKKCGQQSDQTARFNAARMVQTAFYQFHTEKGLFVLLLTRIKIKSRLHIAIVQFDAAKKKLHIKYIIKLTVLQINTLKFYIIMICT